MELPINFHIASGSYEGDLSDWWSEDRTLLRPQRALNGPLAVYQSLKLYMQNMSDVANLILLGVCEKYPRLKFVSVESGVSMLPGALESFDWQWRNGGVAEEHPEYDLLPSEYFRRQCWIAFEPDETLLSAHVEAIGRDRVVFGTDFPHVDHDVNILTRLFEDGAPLDREQLRAALWDNPARLLGFDVEPIEAAIS